MPTRDLFDVGPAPAKRGRARPGPKINGASLEKRRRDLEALAGMHVVLLPADRVADSPASAGAGRMAVEAAQELLDRWDLRNVERLLRGEAPVAARARQELNRDFRTLKDKNKKGALELLVTGGFLVETEPPKRRGIRGRKPLSGFVRPHWERPATK